MFISACILKYIATLCVFGKDLSVLEPRKQAVGTVHGLVSETGADLSRLFRPRLVYNSSTKLQPISDPA
jgi:hypothetical protein